MTGDGSNKEERTKQSGSRDSTPQSEKKSSTPGAPFDVERVALIDVDMQHDFVTGSGAHAVREAAEIVEPAKKLIRFAKEHGISTLSTKLVYPKDHAFGKSQPYCVEGSEGSRKIDECMYPKTRRVIFTAETKANLFTGDQIIFERAVDNPLMAEDFTALLKQIMDRTAIVFGAPLHTTVKQVVIGLRNLQIPTLVASDVVAPRSGKNVEKAIEEMLEAGAEMITSENLLSGCVQIL